MCRDGLEMMSEHHEIIGGHIEVMLPQSNGGEIVHFP